MGDTTDARARRLGLIEATGREAADFLRAQLTNDVLRLGEDNHMLTAWCDARGRAVLVARVLESPAGYLLIVPEPLLQTTLERLRMFVLRSRVELADVSARYRIDGLLDRDLPAANRVEHRAGGLMLGLPSAHADNKRALALGDPASAPPRGAWAVDSAAWELAEIDAGMPTLLPATQRLFVPQMLNLHWLAGIDFDKGCYPGQEVIARLHYRGRLTQRLYRLAWRGTPPVAGDPVVDATGARRGTVVRAAAGGRDSGRLLAVIKVGAARTPLFVGETALETLELPYATPA